VIVLWSQTLLLGLTNEFEKAVNKRHRAYLITPGWLIIATAIELQQCLSRIESCAIGQHALQICSIFKTVSQMLTYLF
jgi:hypothetical protein